MSTTITLTHKFIYVTIFTFEEFNVKHSFNRY